MFDERHEMIRKLARDFAEKELKPIAASIDVTDTFPDEVYKKMAKQGFFGIKAPVELGGGNADYRSYALVMEEFARVSGASSIYVSSAITLVGNPLLNHGTQQQKEKYLKALINGTKRFAFALTEPGAGSDATALTTTAVQDGDYYILNGRKCFITMAPISDYIIVFAKTDPKKGKNGITGFIVDARQEGVSFGKHEDKMGMRGCPTSDVVMENVYIHKDDILGGLNKGLDVIIKTLNLGRVGVAAQAIGLAQGAMDEAIKYAKERKQFGTLISNFQAIQFMLAEMETKLNAAKLLVYNAANFQDKGKPYVKEVSMAKYFASEIAVEIVSRSLQIHGGYGYMKDYPIERMYRDVRVLSIYEGTTEVQKRVISKYILK